MRRLFFLLSLLILFPVLVFSESHSNGQTTTQELHHRGEALSNTSDPLSLFTEEPGDLNDAERNEVDKLSTEIRRAAKMVHKKGENLGEYLSWDQRAHNVLQLQKKLSEKLQNESLKSDAAIAKAELDDLLRISAERKSKGLRKWLSPW
ncbi:MAG: hypothetical protein ACKN9V_00810 [Pseudomonadota bacterium]